MASQDDTPDPRVFLQALLELQPQVEAGSLPRNPAHGVPPNFPRHLFAVFGSGHGNQRIGVQVVDMFEWKHPVKGGVDRRGPAVQVKDAMVEQAYHAVFVVQAFVYVFQAAQPVRIQAGNPGPRQRPDIAARSLNPHHLRIRAGQRVLLDGLATRVPAPVVGDPQIGTEDVGTVEEKGHLVIPETRGMLLIPEVVDVLKGFCFHLLWLTFITL